MMQSMFKRRNINEREDARVAKTPLRSTIAPTTIGRPIFWTPWYLLVAHAPMSLILVADREPERD